MVSGTLQPCKHQHSPLPQLSAAQEGPVQLYCPPRSHPVLGHHGFAFCSYLFTLSRQFRLKEPDDVSAPASVTATVLVRLSPHQRGPDSRLARVPSSRSSAGFLPERALPKASVPFLLGHRRLSQGDRPVSFNTEPGQLWEEGLRVCVSSPGRPVSLPLGEAPSLCDKGLNGPEGPLSESL